METVLRFANFLRYKIGCFSVRAELFIQLALIDDIGMQLPDFYAPRPAFLFLLAFLLGEALLFASKAGAPTNPDWFHNLVANPSVSAELGRDTFAATAEVVEGAERDRVYAAQAAEFANFAEYQTMTERVIPVVRLVRS